MALIPLKTWYYQQFDADLDHDVPAEGYGGWKQAELEIAREHTAVVVMHAWDTGTAAEFPGWYRAVDYLPRAQEIVREVFPPLLAAIREAGVAVIHVVDGGSWCTDHFRSLPGYLQTVEVAGPEPTLKSFPPLDAAATQLREFRSAHVSPGTHNKPDIDSGFARLDFPDEARPLPGEAIAESSHQLLSLCRHHGYSHLIYAGFAINWCLLLSPGGMADMNRNDILCSALRQAVTAVENKESARHEWAKELALWRVALAFGFVYDVPDFIDALRNCGQG